MTKIHVTYDSVVDAAYLYLSDPKTWPGPVTTYPCDPIEVGGMINLDFDEDGRLVGIEVLAARSKLPSGFLDEAMEEESNNP